MALAAAGAAGELGRSGMRGGSARTGSGALEMAAPGSDKVRRSAATARNKMKRAVRFMAAL